MPEKNEFLSLPEVASLMGISRIAVFKKVKKGRLPAIRIGRNWAVPAAALRIPRPPEPQTVLQVPNRAVPQALSQDAMDDIGWD
ncbi:MAG: excisionase family DNA-binding protein [Elusimicrobiales bacterium]|jgi:excisionase family DNA binding protein